MIYAKDPKGFELESSHPIYRFAKGRFAHEVRKERKPLMVSGVWRFIWSVCDCKQNSRSVRSVVVLSLRDSNQKVQIGLALPDASI